MTATLNARPDLTGGGPKVSEPTPPSSEAKASILLVDDREDKRLAMETIIADLGENIISVSSGNEALRCLLSQEFAVILLDVNMPGMDGFETAHLIRQRKSSEFTPIIFITGISDTETHVSRGYSLGAVDYILTPVMPDVLRTKVSVFVELYKKTEQIKQQAERLRHAHDQLDLRVRERTAELAVTNQALQAEIGERRRAEDKILKINGELEHRVSERTSELAAANLELEAFTYSVAHDLQAPLRNIQSYAQLLDDDFSEGLASQGQQYLKRIGVRARFMRQLVEDLLSLSRIGKQNLNCQNTSLRTLLDEAVAGFQSDTEGRQIEWVIGELPEVSCDPALVRQVLTNLLSNAIKYTQSREKALIEVGQEKNAGEVSVFIRDNGVGFDMRYLDKLFGAFQRLHRPGQYDGTGVGLAIVARIIHKHGGRVWAEGEEEKGATFHFTLAPHSSETSAKS